MSILLHDYFGVYHFDTYDFGTKVIRLGLELGLELAWVNFVGVLNV